MASARPKIRPLLVLTQAFVLWKIVLFAIVALRPGPDYDTSTELFFELQSSAPATQALAPSGIVFQFIAKLIRWDAMYYVSIAERGFVYEQEWAFGWGFTSLVRAAARCKHASSMSPTLQAESA